MGVVRNGHFWQLGSIASLATETTGGDKGRDLTGNSDPTHGAFDFSVHYIARYLYLSIGIPVT